MRYEDLKYLEVPLPEAIAKEKWGGFMLLLLLIIRELNGIVIIIMK